MKYILVIVALIFLGCKETQEQSVTQDVAPEWEYSRTITVDGVNPIGITTYGNSFILSDGDHNRIVYVDTAGAILRESDGFERPMHIDYGAFADQKYLLIPEYGKDSVAQMYGKQKNYLELNDSLDAPAAAAISKDHIAIADFYNNRILVKSKDSLWSFGVEGKNDGEFYYPTDVQIFGDQIFVADAYNHRGQVFDLYGKHLATFAENDSLNAATGIYKSKGQIALTDFENDRVMIYSNNFQKKQALSENVHKPTDVLIIGDSLLYITNYRNGELVEYRMQE
ncbi:hypothetical protein BST97_12310 [Nonlabens spongiae]|uniref:NHL repeat-containing protein n=1 Tax=Nonlabens spongiae TaxID=331648 RepID=A0A1W6MMB8_9FLAO|nr:hypothetical protein [Nonlabens spongiae]ARN78712.1 hypothetical protein BST97_12310 [Nonlabens spongiae]